MSRRYDSKTTIFSPEGRLYQVEYAQEAIFLAGITIGIKANDGIVFACEKKVTTKLLDDDDCGEKIYHLNDNIMCAVAGLSADASILVENSRIKAQNYLRKYNTEIPCEILVKNICNIKQGYTQYGGLRPFGVSFLYAGYDEKNKFQLFMSNPSGNYSGWKATSIGANKSTIQTLLKKDHNDDMKLEDACKLAIKILHKTIMISNLNSEKIELATISLSQDLSNKIIKKIWKKNEIDLLIENTDLEDQDSK